MQSSFRVDTQSAIINGDRTLLGYEGGAAPVGICSRRPETNAVLYLMEWQSAFAWKITIPTTDSV